MSRKIKLDMTGVESYTRCPEGEWLAKLKKIEQVEIKGSGDDGLKAQFEVIKGKAKGSSVFETFSLSENALWKLKSFLEAAGVKSTGRLSLDLDKLEGKICIIDVIHDDYNGQKRAKISAYIKPGEDDDDEDEDEDDVMDDDEDEDEEPKKPAKKSSKSAPAKKATKKRPEPEDDDEDEDEEDEDDEDDEEPEPPKKAKKAPAKSSKSSKKPAPKKKSKPEPEEDEDDEDDEDDWEEDDD